jgi:uncharacterized membrane protein YuzA (DUF378 family)
MGVLYALLFIAQILILVGALNWGLVAYKIDILKSLFSKDYVNVAYKIIGLSAVLVISVRLYNVIDPMLRIK